MRTFPFLFALWLAAILLPGCAKKQAVVTDAPNATTTKYAGTVTMKGAPECPLLIMLDPGTGDVPLIPIGLNAMYQNEGMRLKFTYRPSRASSGNCAKGTPAILEDIAVIGSTPPK